MTQLWCNGQWMDSLDFPISHSDRGLTLGLGLFETFLAVDGEPVLAERHMVRFRRGCERLGWSLVLPDLKFVMRELLLRNELQTGRARIRLSLTAGSGWVNRLSLGSDYVLWIQAVAAGVPPAYTTAAVSPYVRNEKSALCGLKCASYAENVVAMEHSARLGFEEALFFNTAGHLCEAATANVFLVRNGALHTPALSSGCLPGITREAVIGLAESAGISCNECDLELRDLEDADEVFITSSIRGVMGLSRVGDRAFTSLPVTDRLRVDWEDGLRGRTFIEF